jgi:hypothetical protein
MSFEVIMLIPFKMRITSHNGHAVRYSAGIDPAIQRQAEAGDV